VDRLNELNKPDKPNKPIETRNFDVSQGKDPGQYFIFDMKEINRVRSPPL
jgi:hypothetical protein